MLIVGYPFTYMVLQHVNPCLMTKYIFTHAYIFLVA